MYFINKKKATVKQLQSLAGVLNFLNRAIHPGHVFTRRMYAKFSHVVKIDNNPNANPEITLKFKLKQFHHVNLDAEFHRDCQTWLNIL